MTELAEAPQLDSEIVRDFTEAIVAAKESGTLDATFDVINHALAEEGVDAEVKPKDWHEKEHGWAIVTDMILRAEVLSPFIPVNDKAKLIGKMLVHDERFSTTMNDTRHPDEKPLNYYRSRLYKFTSQRSKVRH